MKKLTNPLDNRVTFCHKGDWVALEAKENGVFSDELAVAWKQVHGFLTLEDVSEAVVVEPEVVAEVVETEAVPAEEIVAEAPKVVAKLRWGKKK